jgi:hypothetical protein
MRTFQLSWKLTAKWTNNYFSTSVVRKDVTKHIPGNAFQLWDWLSMFQQKSLKFPWSKDFKAKYPLQIHSKIMARNVNHLMRNLRSCGPRLHSTAIHSGSVKYTVWIIITSLLGFSITPICCCLQDSFDQNVEKYSIYQPTPISIAHFIEFGKTASTESRWQRLKCCRFCNFSKLTLFSSFLFLKREVPVRLANIMKVIKSCRNWKMLVSNAIVAFQELMLMPDELRKTRACNLVINQYRTSFQVWPFYYKSTKPFRPITINIGQGQVLICINRCPF